MTARPLHPGELLDLADRLAGRGSGPGRPRTIELRRAVSSAYYGLFHELAWRGTEALLQTAGAWTPQAAQVSRWITHTSIRQLADHVTAARGNRALTLALPHPHPDLVRVGDAFSTLQDERHRADYDDFYDLTKALTLSLLDSAREAVALSAHMAERSEPTYEISLRLMLSASQAKTRST